MDIQDKIELHIKDFRKFLVETDYFKEREIDKFLLSKNSIMAKKLHINSFFYNFDKPKPPFVVLDKTNLEIFIKKKEELLCLYDQEDVWMKEQTALALNFVKNNEANLKDPRMKIYFYLQNRFWKSLNFTRCSDGKTVDLLPYYYDFVSNIESVSDPKNRINFEVSHNTFYNLNHNQTNPNKLAKKNIGEFYEGLWDEWCKLKNELVVFLKETNN